MSKLDELIAELCPDGVPFYKMGELGKFYGGLTGKSKDDFSNGNAKFITYRNVYSNPALKLDVSDSVKIAEGEKQRTLEYGDVIFTGSSETPDECGISSVLTLHTDEKLYLNSFCIIFRFNDTSIMLPDFAKHLFRSASLRYQIGKTASGVTRFNVSKKLMQKVVIPVPPLPVQSEIVSILDNFTELTAELTAELAARKKQYDFYKNILFTFSSNVEWTKLSDVCDIYDSLHQTPKYSNTGFPMIRVVDVKGDIINCDTCLKVDEQVYKQFIKKYKPKVNDIVISRVGSYGNVGLVINDDVCLGQNVALISAKHCSYNFLFYYLQSNLVSAFIESNVNGASQKTLSLAKIKDIPFPKLTEEEQNRISVLMGNFHKICNDISSGLPAEIEARRKQYEYYRDKLLSFDELEATV